MKIGIISFAHMHAYDYANALKTIGDVELVGIYDENDERGNAASLTYDTPYFKSLDEFLDCEMDAVIITSENSKHKEHVLKSAEKGLDILCEKPISTNRTDALTMIDACKNYGVKLQIAYPVRFCGAIKEAKAILDTGKLGTIKAIKTTNRGRNPGGWFVDPVQSGGGAVLDHTVHMVDIVRWFTGKEIVEVYAEVDQMFSDVPIDDAGILDMTLEDGIHMTHDCSWSKNDRYPTWGDVTIEVYGTQGSMLVDAFKDHLVEYADTGAAVQEHFSGNDMNLELIEDFVNNVKTNTNPWITGFDGLQSMVVALAAYESSAIHQPVKL